MEYGFENCTKTLPLGADQRHLLKHATLRFGALERVAVLAPSGSGKSSLVRLLSGMDQPSQGQIFKPAKLSWPIGFAGFLHPVMTGEQNIRTLCDMMQIDGEWTSAFVEHFAELGDHYRRPVQEYSGGMRSRLATSFSLAVPFPFYVADDSIGTGDAEFRAKCDMMMDRRLESAGLFFATSNSRLAERYATRFAVIFDAQLVECSTIGEAKALLDTANEDEEQFSRLLTGLQYA